MQELHCIGGTEEWRKPTGPVGGTLKKISLQWITWVMRYVFNIKGNHYRLIAMIHFNIRTVYVRFIGTHAAYDAIEDITNI